MKKHFSVLGLMLMSFLTVTAQNSVTIKGKVQFIDPGFKIQVINPNDKKVLAETTVQDNHTYQLQVPVTSAGEAIVDCGKWQRVAIWLEDEPLEIDFRGKDTARIKIKNPPYVYIKGGKNNELMNRINFESYRNYQTIIAVSQAAYRAEFKNDEEKSKLSSTLYDYSYENFRVQMRYLVEHYADRPSVLAAIKRLNYEKEEKFILNALEQLEKSNPQMKDRIAQYVNTEKEKKAQKERLAPGKPAPDFSFVTSENKEMKLSDLKGKILVVDFWASWCGPCRNEIPKLKDYSAYFKGKDVQFLSVSIDKRQEDWTKALNEEKMEWTQGWVKDAGKEVMKLYQFGGIPHIIVLDQDGNIYKKGVRGEQVKKAVESLLQGEKPAEKSTISMGMMGM